MDNQVPHERVSKLHNAYTAFVAAAIISLISGDGHIATESWAICLWALSLPWLIAFVLLDYIVREKQKRKNSVTRGLMVLIGYGLSNLGTAALLVGFSWVAGIVFLLSIPICGLYIHEVAGLGYHKEFKDL